MNNKARIYSIVILTLLLILCSSFPISYFISDYYIIFSIKNSLRIIFIIFALFYIRRESLHGPKYKSVRGKNILVTLPFLILCFSNLLVVMIAKTPINSHIDSSILVCDIVSSLLVAICEEIVFRVAILMELKESLGPIKALVISSLIFGACHLLNITSVATILPSLVQAVYTFVLGMVFGYIYFKNENIILPILFHFLFNVINNDLIKNIYLLNWDITFYLVNTIIGLIITMYLLLLLHLDNPNCKKGENSYDL